MSQSSRFTPAGAASNGLPAVSITWFTLECTLHSIYEERVRAACTERGRRNNPRVRGLTVSPHTLRLIYTRVTSFSPHVPCFDALACMCVEFVSMVCALLRCITINMHNYDRVPTLDNAHPVARNRRILPRATKGHKAFLDISFDPR